MRVTKHFAVRVNLKLASVILGASAGDAFTVHS